MYFRGEWAYCPEYKTGDVVLYEGILYLSLKPNAGKPPDENKEYWQNLMTPLPPKPPVYCRRIIDGGYASTESNDHYAERTLREEIDGGGAAERVHVPLI